MINIVIIGKDINYCKELINNLNAQNKNLRVCAIIDKFQEVQIALDTYDIDVILIEKIFYDSLYKSLKSYLNSIILISEQKYEFNYANINFFNKGESFESLNIKINEVFNNSNKTKIKKIIASELNYLGYNPNYIGTEYLIEAIFILYIKGAYSTDNLEKNVYALIAKKYNKTISSVKFDITYATDIMFYDCEENKLLDYLKLGYLYKPGPKKVICAVLYRIHNQRIKNGVNIK